MAVRVFLVEDQKPLEETRSLVRQAAAAEVPMDCEPTEARDAAALVDALERERPGIWALVVVALARRAPEAGIDGTELTEAGRATASFPLRHWARQAISIAAAQVPPPYSLWR